MASAVKTPTADAIRFWKPTKKPYGVFSNYHPSPLVMEDEKRYTSSEAYYQSRKFSELTEAGAWYRERVRLAKTPHQSKCLASQRLFPPERALPFELALNPLIEEAKRRGVVLRDDWEEHKLEVMEYVLRAKFDQHPALKRLLLETGDKPIYEISPYDTYWGTGRDGKGKNVLGKMLVSLRNEYREPELEAAQMLTGLRSS